MLYDEALAAAARGDTTQAQTLLFEVVRLEPRHAGAWLDMALLACAAGDAGSAQALVQQVAERFTLPPEVRALIATQLAQPCHTGRAARMSFGVVHGYDSNVNFGTRASHLVLGGGADAIELPLSKDLRPRGDRFNEWWGELITPLPGPALPDTLLRVGLLQRKHAHESAYDLRAIALSAETPAGSGAWRGTGRLAWMSSWLGDARYLDTLTAGWAGATPWAAAGYPVGYELVLADAKFAGSPQFDALTLTARLGLHGTATDTWQWRSGLVLIADRGQAERPGGNRLGGGLEAAAVRQLTDKVRLTLQGHALDMRNRAAYYPPLLNMKRHQVLLTARVELAVDLGHGAHWVTGWNGTDSRDNLSFLAYRSSTLQTGLVLSF